MWSIGTTFLSHSETVLSEIRLPQKKNLIIALIKITIADTLHV